MAEEDEQNRNGQNQPEEDQQQEQEQQIPSGTAVIPQEPGSEQQLSVPDTLPLLPMRDLVVFPFMIIPLFVGRENSKAAVNEALSKDRLICLTVQKDASVEDPGADDIHEIGCVGMIMRMLKLPDGRLKILVQGLMRGRITQWVSDEPYKQVKIETVQESAEVEKTVEMQALMRNIRDGLQQMINMGKMLSPDIMVVLESIEHPGRYADLVASNIGLNVTQAQEVLDTTDPLKRLRKVNELLSKELELLNVQNQIASQTKEELEKNQREYFLREQLKKIKQELGESDEREAEIEQLREKIEAVGMPEEAYNEAQNQLKRLERMHPDAMEAGMIRTYLEWMVEIPWSNYTEDMLDIKKAQGVLDEDHYDLEKVKDRILEQLSVLKLKTEKKAPILCFVGPPGVGKTSLGRSIARAMGRNFMRISLGGIRDEAEIRGHRRTYVGAMPGRIIQGMKQAGTKNPIFMLDEIDKLGMDFRGDPSSALLEVLDPEQNFSFRDHYLNVEYDLSRVMFITTANMVEPIPPALYDRMETIMLPGYTTEEKMEIARKFLLPRQVEVNGIMQDDIKISTNAIEKVITHYTREAGVRNLERNLGNLCRKVARKIAEGESGPVTVNQGNLQTFLGVPQHLPEVEVEEDQVGVATGLAWTPAGGEMLRVETTLVTGKGRLTITGQLGDVMKESAQAALSYARRVSSKYGVAKDFFEKNDVHIHVPAGAVPKDGPSAGITMVVSLVSAMSNIPVRKDISMTGEITLRGRLMPIGGLKEKALAALRAGIPTVVAPERNKKDLDEIPAHLKRKVNFVFAKNVDEVLEIALKQKTKKTPKKKTTGAKKTAAKGKSQSRRTPQKKSAASEK